MHPKRCCITGIAVQYHTLQQISIGTSTSFTDFKQACATTINMTLTRRIMHLMHPVSINLYTVHPETSLLNKRSSIAHYLSSTPAPISQEGASEGQPNYPTGFCACNASQCEQATELTSVYTHKDNTTIFLQHQDGLTLPRRSLLSPVSSHLSSVSRFTMVAAGLRRSPVQRKSDQTSQPIMSSAGSNTSAQLARTTE